MRIAFTAGGTGGHIYPAIAVAEELLHRDPATEIQFISGKRPVERAIIGTAGFTMDEISVIGLPRKMSFRLPVFAMKLAFATIVSARILKRFAPSVLLATGGYVSGPPVLAAILLGIPVCLQEQNAYPGITTKKLASRASMVFLGSKDAARYFGKQVKTQVTGNPVRPGLDEMSREDGAAVFSLDPAVSTVLVFGGSQGARRINEAVAGIVPDLSEQGYQLIWQTGAAEHERWRQFNEYEGVVVKPYLDNMAAAYAASDCAVTRAGAMTIAELTTCGLPAILIPLPTAAEKHQDYNAQALEKAGAGYCIDERELSPDRLKRTIWGILDDQETRAAMKAASLRQGTRDAAQRIADYLLEHFSEN